MLAFLVTLGLASPVDAWGGDGTSVGGSGSSSGGSGCGSGSSSGGSGGWGCFIVPPELSDRARLLEGSFNELHRDVLARQSWAGELCANHPCGEEVTEEQAKELLRDLFSRAQRAEDIARADRDRMVTWAGVVTAGLSALISVFALWQTHHANQVARSASDRSIRNEAHLEHLRADGTRSSKG